MAALAHFYSIQKLKFQVWNRILMPLEIKALANCQSNEQAWTNCSLRGRNLIQILSCPNLIRTNCFMKNTKKTCFSSNGWKNPIGLGQKRICINERPLCLQHGTGIILLKTTRLSQCRQKTTILHGGVYFKISQLNKTQMTAV
jgi:hypothetical protein